MGLGVSDISSLEPIPVVPGHPVRVQRVLGTKERRLKLPLSLY